MADDTLDVRMRLRDAGSFIAGVKAASESVKGFGAAAHTAARQTELSRIETFAWRQGLYTLRRELFYGTIALTGLGAGIVKVGYDFNEAQDKATAAFTGILGSATLARREVDALIGLTHVTGFQLTELSGAATKMLDFGFSVSQTNEQLRAFGLFAQKRNLGVAGIDTLVNVFAKLKDQGQLTGRELRALRTAGVPALTILRKELGLTNQQVEQLKKGKLVIPAAFAIPALTRGIAAIPGTLGQGGLVGITRSWVAQLTGLFEKPLFLWAQRMAPRLNAALARAVTGFKTGGVTGMLTGLDPSGRLLKAWETLTSVARGLWDMLGKGWRIVAPLLPIFGALAGILITVANNSTLLHLVLYALITRYLYLRVVLGAVRLAVWAWTVVMKAGWLAIRAFYVAEQIWIGITKAAAAAQWLLNIAMDANPIGLLIIGAIALGAGLAYLVLRVHGVRDAFVDAFGWVRDHWPLLLAILSLPVAIAVFFIRRHFDAIKDAARGALNWIIRGWDSLHFRIPGFSLGPVHFGGFNLGLPHIPLLDAGGLVTQTGLSVVHRNEVVQPARVRPLDWQALGGVIELHAHLHIGDREVLESVLRFPAPLADAVAGQWQFQGARA